MAVKHHQVLTPLFFPLKEPNTQTLPNFQYDYRQRYSILFIYFYEDKNTGEGSQHGKLFVLSDKLHFSDGNKSERIRPQKIRIRCTVWYNIISEGGCSCTSHKNCFLFIILRN